MGKNFDHNEIVFIFIFLIPSVCAVMKSTDSERTADIYIYIYVYIYLYVYINPHHSLLPSTSTLEKTKKKKGSRNK
jgi:hypothetical protein